MLECVGTTSAVETAFGTVRDGGVISRVGVRPYAESPIGPENLMRNIALTGGGACRWHLHGDRFVRQRPVEYRRHGDSGRRRVNPNATNPTSRDYQESFADAVPPLVVGKDIDEVNVSSVAGSTSNPRGLQRRDRDDQRTGLSGDNHRPGLDGRQLPMAALAPHQMLTASSSGLYRRESHQVKVRARGFGALPVQFSPGLALHNRSVSPWATEARVSGPGPQLCGDCGLLHTGRILFVFDMNHGDKEHGAARLEFVTNGHGVLKLGIRPPSYKPVETTN